MEIDTIDTMGKHMIYVYESSYNFWTIIMVLLNCRVLFL